MTGDPPRIRELSWGRIELEDGSTFKDAKCWPGGARAWDWDETGTSHEPGIQPADVEELLEHGVDLVVLSRGQHARLQVMPETLKHLHDAGVVAEVHRTEQAVERYNDLVEDGVAVGGLFHSTC